MKILIVGGTSSLAQALKPVLSEFAEVITAGRSACDLHLDLSKPLEQILLPKDIDVVINAAASFGGKSFDDMYWTECVNVLGTLKLCQASTTANVRHFVSISSTSAYLRETSAYYGVYALSKKQADELIQLFCPSFNLPFTILRPSQLYGNEDIFRKRQPFLYTAIDKAEKNEDINIYGCKDALRNYIHIEDFTKIISLVITKKIEGLYACTHEVDVSLLNIANTAIEVFCSTGQVNFLKDREDIQDNIFPYDDSLYNKINYFPQVTMAEGVRKIAAYRRLSTT